MYIFGLIINNTCNVYIICVNMYCVFALLMCIIFHWADKSPSVGKCM